MITAREVVVGRVAIADLCIGHADEGVSLGVADHPDEVGRQRWDPDRLLGKADEAVRQILVAVGIPVDGRDRRLGMKIDRPGARVRRGRQRADADPILEQQGHRTGGRRQRILLAGPQHGLHLVDETAARPRQEQSEQADDDQLCAQLHRLTRATGNRCRTRSESDRRPRRPVSACGESA